MTNNIERLRKIGKAMMIPLRYGSGNFSAVMDAEGFAPLSEVLNHELIKSLNASAKELEAIDFYVLIINESYTTLSLIILLFFMTIISP